ncbi:MAG: YidC/Oxa1 family insertase periplasmic-domain containing protein [Chthoniobacterales bacterium]
MDRKTWIVIGLCIAAFLSWQWYYNATYGPYLKQQDELRRQKALAAAAAQPSPTGTPATATTPATTPAAVPSAIPQAVMAARNEELTSEGKKDESADYIFNNDTGGIEAVRLVKHTREGGAVTLNGDRRMPIGALATTPGTALGGFEMKVDAANNTVTFTKRDGDGLEIVKKFTLPPNNSAEAPYVANLEITFRNPTAITLSRPGYFVSTGSAAPIHKLDLPTYTRFDWANSGGMRGRDVNAFNASVIPLIGIQIHPAQETFSETLADIQWAGVATQYFCTIVSAVEPKASSVWTSRFVVPGEPGSAPVYGLQGALGFAGFTLEPQKSTTQKFTIYAGPKEGPRLAKLPYDEKAVLNFGWFGFISEFLLWAMNLLHDVFKSYGVAIIVLTLIIKTMLWPLQNKATNSMRKMSALSPKMTEMKEKYKDDPTKMNQEMMKLYRDYGVNPFSGCLPMLIQIPIFFGFYGMLGTAIELRNSSFLGGLVPDLSQPDTVGHILGFPINILPLVMAGTMLWQMAISPKSGDATQQRILMFMPVIFIVFAYNYASALSLYWTTQNLFSIVQLYLTRNRPLPTLEKMAVVKKRPGPGGSKPRKKRPS